MNKEILITKQVEDLSNEISSLSAMEADFFPVDRIFLEQYVPEIDSVDYLEFILFNIEKVNPTYVTQLFLCLPELWIKITYDDFDILIDNFSNSFSYYTLILFTYKYLEIDILDLIVNKSIVKGYYTNVKEYLILQGNVIIKTDEERYDLEFNEGKDFLLYDTSKWSYIKQKLLTDSRIKEAKQDYNYLKARISELIS